LDFFVMMIYSLHEKKCCVCDKSKINIPPFKKAEHVTAALDEKLKKIMACVGKKVYYTPSPRVP